MKLLKQTFSDLNRDLFYQTNPEAHIQSETASGVDRVQNLLDQTDAAKAQRDLWSESAEDRIGFARETFQAEKDHYQESLKMSPEDSQGLDEELDHELLSIKEKEAQEVGRLKKSTEEKFNELVTGPIDAITGIKASGWESAENAGSAEAVIDITNPNPSIADSVLKPGDVSEETSIMKS